jgi:Domain of unknown function (DUF4136)
MTLRGNERTAMKIVRALVYGACVTALVALTGCSTVRLVENDVTSFAQWPGGPPPSGTTYRFERLPSQQSLQGRPLAEVPQDQLEAMARAALDKAGLVNNPERPALNVQVAARTNYVQRYPYDDYGFFGRPGLSLGAGNVGSFIGLSFPLGGRMESPLYKREVSLVMRDARSNAVVYETRAVNDGIWGDANAVLPIMFGAALQGFPVPPAGTRRVNVEIPR